MPPACALDARGDARVLAPDANGGAEALVVSPGTRVKLTLVPETAEAKEMIARLFVVSGGTARSLAARPPPGRVVHLEGLREELFASVPAGRHELVVLFAFADTPGDDEALATMARDPERPVPGWRAVRRPLELRGGTTGQVAPGSSEIEAATALRKAGKIDEAEKRLATAPASLPRTRLAARIAFDHGRTAEAAALFTDAITAGRAAADPEGTGKDVIALAYVELRRDAAAAAEALLDANAGFLAAWPAGTGDVLYTRGMIARTRGDLRAELALLRDASTAAEIAGRTETRDAADDLRADVLATLGRHTEALALARSIPIPDDASPRALHARNNTAWIELRAARAGAGGDVAQAITWLGESLALTRAAGDATGAGKVLTNLGIALLEDGDPEGARWAVEDAERSEDPADPADAVWWAQIEGEADLASGRPDAALARFQQARALAARHPLPEAAFMGAVGEAQALDALDRASGARDAFEDAASALDAWAREAPLGEGRGSFLAEHARAVRLQASFLLRSHHEIEALNVVRRGAARYFALVDAPDSGPLHAPPPPPEGTVLLAAAVLSEGPTVIAARDDHAASARVAALTPEGLAGGMAPLAEVLRGASRLRVPAGGALRHVDVHAALVEGRPLAARLAVEYTLDLPPLTPHARPAGAVALVVADPSEDLPAVRATLAALSAALEAQGLHVRRIDGAGATREAFRAAVAGSDVELLYYAGHAAFAGQDGLDAALVLADGAFTVREVLALPRVPPYAVLLGCSSARTDLAGDSLGVAQAFLVKGTLAVVAARADLSAAVVERLGAGLVTDLGAVPDLPVALARAQTALAAAEPPVDWPILRALVR